MALVDNSFQVEQRFGIGERRGLSSRIVTPAVMLVVSGVAGAAIMNRRYGWFSSSHEISISPGRLLDVVAFVLAVLVVHELRSLHRTRGGADLVVTASAIFVAGIAICVNAVLPSMGSPALQLLHLAAGLSLAAVSLAAIVSCRTPDRFAAHVPLAVACMSVAGGIVLAAATYGPNVSFATASAAVASVGAAVGLALTIAGLRKVDIVRQILGLLVLSAATLGTHASTVDADVAVLVHKLTFAGLLATLALQLVVELRNATVTAQSTAERTEADLDLSNAMLRRQREERAQLIHDSRNALLVIQAGLRSVSDDTSAALIASLNSELNRIQAMIERSHTPIQALHVADALGPMLQCYQSAGTEITVVADSKAPAVAMASGTQLVEIMQNLIENAIRHAQSPYPIEVAIVGVDEHVEVRVRDFGDGIDMRDRIRMTERLVAKSGLGTGRGLSTSQRLAQEMGGELDFFDAPNGEGTILCLRLVSADVVQAVAS